MKEGRWPFLQLAYKVNWETRSSSPPTSESDRLVFPLSSSKIRILSALSSILSAMSVVSVSLTPTRIRSPLLILPMIASSTVTFASSTRCITNFIFFLPFFFSQTSHFKNYHVVTYCLLCQRILYLLLT